MVVDDSRKVNLSLKISVAFMLIQLKLVGFHCPALHLPIRVFGFQYTVLFITDS